MKHRWISQSRISKTSHQRPAPHSGVTAGEDPVEVRVVVRDRLDRRAYIAEELADLRLAVRESPLREVDLRVFGEEVEDAAAGRGDAAVVERLQVLQGDRLALLVGHVLV